MTTRLQEQIETPARPSLMALVWQYRRTVALCAGIGLLFGGLLALTRPLTFSASATLLFPTTPSSRLSAVTGDGGGDLPGLPLLNGALVVPQPGSSAATASLLLRSRQAAVTIVRQLHLRAAWGLPTEQDAIKRFQKRLQCKAGKSGELTIGFQDKSGKLAYQIVAALVDRLNLMSRDLGLDPAEADVAFLSQQLSDAQVKLNIAQRALVTFQQQNHMLSVPDEAKLLIGQYADLRMDVTKAKLEAATASHQAKLVSSSAERLIRASQDPMPSPDNTLAPLYKNVTRLQADVALLQETLTADHPDVVQKTAELDEARRTLNREIARQTDLLKSGSSPIVRDAVIQAATTQAKADGLQATLDHLQGQVARLPQQQEAYARLTSEVAAHADAVTLFRAELEKARIIAERTGPLFVVADPPMQPRERDPAHRGMLLALSLMLGIAVGLLFPYLAWFRCQQQIEEARWAEYIRSSIGR